MGHNLCLWNAWRRREGRCVVRMCRTMFLVFIAAPSFFHFDCHALLFFFLHIVRKHGNCWLCFGETNNIAIDCLYIGIGLNSTHQAHLCRPSFRLLPCPLPSPFLPFLRHSSALPSVPPSLRSTLPPSHPSLHVIPGVPLVCDLRALILLSHCFLQIFFFSEFGSVKFTISRKLNAFLCDGSFIWDSYTTISRGKFKGCFPFFPRMQQSGIGWFSAATWNGVAWKTMA